MNGDEEDHSNLIGISIDPIVADDLNNNQRNGGTITIMDELDVPREIVLQRILELVHSKVVRPLFVPSSNNSNDGDDTDDEDKTTNQHSAAPEMIEIDNKSFYHLSHCRSLTSILLVASYCQKLLLSNRTTTMREVYYYYVTHFFHQKECDKAIWDLARILQVSRSSLGLYASPKGWFCGCIDLFNQQGNLVLNGRELDNLHGMPITSTIHKQHTNMASHDAQFILVIEKEGVYTRLAEDKFFLREACILVTGKGFPDMATRQWVRQMASTLQLPVYGLADCNPYGIAVLHSYQYQESYAQRQAATTAAAAASNSNTTRNTTRNTTTSDNMEERPFVIQWLGLRPSQLLLDPQLNNNNKSSALPSNVFQALTDRDAKLLQKFQSCVLDQYHPFVQEGLDPEQRWQELELLNEKVELEALNWKGMDFLSQWVQNLVVQAKQKQKQRKTNAGTMLAQHGGGELHNPNRQSQPPRAKDDSTSAEVRMKWNQII
ncbi:unnamed protein product [Cylindrotheca closterium]|uniref:DNA topoisomerase (ATP-hydrolyzing) n=1 Tax=Cylindrotheca closterium TaxID=2856 RepID=A0AAD2JNX8_9STRA|nr:unnamed protein product [Cylindrotheca closterium]